MGSLIPTFLEPSTSRSYLQDAGISKTLRELELSGENLNAQIQLLRYQIDKSWELETFNPNSERDIEELKAAKAKEDAR